MTSRDEALRALEKAVELVAKATPGPWEALTPCEPNDYVTDIRSDDDGQLVAATYTEHDGRLVSAAVNFIREHGAAILSARQEVAPVAMRIVLPRGSTTGWESYDAERAANLSKGWSVELAYSSPAHTSEARDAELIEAVGTYEEAVRLFGRTSPSASRAYCRMTDVLAAMQAKEPAE